MNKKLLTIAIALMVLAIVVAPVTATLPAQSPLPKGFPFNKIWELLQDLQAQILNIPAGAQGPQGEQGPQGPQGETGPAGATVHFGEWSGQGIGSLYQPATNYPAATDGFVLVDCYLGYSGPETAGSSGHSDYSPEWNDFGIVLGFDLQKGESGSFTMPVRAGDTWRVNYNLDSSMDCDILWLPLSA